ncbi:hypothetical protein MTP99_013506 [Tenebrio molitor]|jgi:hypothetical protein|uniref:uncharacterized protein n=1 Tax=Tenebrio molitor TaxID=7067 RepID=UPI001C3BFEAD|nr:hypothetical protein MTP99_013506 [Tenebrio molitor]CAH1372011.1 unnamed protein product [Tenebrio molitor]
MSRKHFILCLTFSLWTIIQTAIHLGLVIYAYFLSICESSPTAPETIFFYLTYLYNKDCSVPKLKVPNKVNSTSVETIVLTFFSGFYSEDASSFENIVLELLQKLQFFPDYAAESSRTSVFLLCFIILDGAWIISAVSLLMGTCCGIKENLSWVFYGPWLVMTICVSIFDALASIFFGQDISETINFSNWVKFVGIDKTSEFAYLDAKNSTFLSITPSVVLCALSTRFVVIWISNLVGFFFVLQATLTVFRQSYKNPPSTPPYHAHSPATDRPDLNTSEARIRSWQLFYGAIDTTTSTQSGKSSEDLNSNRKDSGETNQSVATLEGTACYYAYPDVAESVLGERPHLEELRGQLPWSYVAPKEGASSSEMIELAYMTKKLPDSSVFGTEI